MQANKLNAAILTALLGSGLAHAENTVATTEEVQQPELETVTVTGTLDRYGATKSTAPILETARSVSVITEESFKNFGALSLDDALNYSAGVQGDTYGFSTRGDFPKVRGLDAKEYRDGQQVLFGFYNNTRSEVYLLEQVEVLKGPASVLYGKGSTGGIVNAISKTAGPDKDNEVVLEVGNHNRKQLSLDLNSEVGNNLYARAVAFYRDSDTQVDNVNDDSLGVMPSLTFDNGTTRVTGLVEYIDRDSDTSHQFLPLNATGCLSSQVKVTPDTACAAGATKELDSSAYMGDPDFNKYNSESTMLSLLGSHKINKNLEVEGVIRHKKAEVDYDQTWVVFTGAGTPRIDNAGNTRRTYYATDASTEQLAADLRLRLDFDTGPVGHEMVAGISYQDITTDTDSVYVYAGDDIYNIYNPVNGDLPADIQAGEANAPEQNTEDKGVYVNNQMSIENFKINLGLRYDETSAQTKGADAQDDDALSRSLGILYAFENGLSPYVSYAESFEPVLGLDTVTEKAKKPREGEQVEVGLKFQPDGTSTYVTVAYFDIKETNLDNPAALQGVVPSQQEGEATSTGYEIEAFSQFGDISAQVNLTKLDTENVNGFTFDSVPETQASAWIGYEPSQVQGLKSGLGIRHAGENESNGAGTNGVVNVETDGYTIYDAMIGYEMQEWDFTLNLRNLTDKEYYSTCLARGDCFPGERRTIVASAAYQF